MTIKALLVHPGALPVEIEVEPHHTAMREQVGGWLEAVGGDARDGGWVAYGDEEGALKGLPVNDFASRMLGQTIVGPVLLCGLRQGDPEDGLMEADWTGQE